MLHEGQEKLLKENEMSCYTSDLSGFEKQIAQDQLRIVIFIEFWVDEIVIKSKISGIYFMPIPHSVALNIVSLTSKYIPPL